MTRFLLALGVIAFRPAVAAAQADSLTPPPDTTAVAGVGVKATLGAPPLTLRVPAQYQEQWAIGPRPVPGATATAWQASLSSAVDSAQTARTSNQVLISLYGGSQEAADSAEAALQKRGLFGINRNLVDLTLDGNIRLELRADRLKNLRCTPASLSDPSSGCRGEINGPRLDNQMSIRSGGVIGRRLRVNVDWDTQRDYTNSNIIQVYYEGLEDEPVRRVEVGSVAFRPPPSRYLTASIPTNNFGVNALFELGQLQMQVLAATQKGSAIGERVFTIGQATATPQDRSQRDLDFEYGRFYWTVDPRTLPHYPAIDVLSLDTLTVSPDVRPAQIRVYRYRVPQLTGGVDPNLGGIPACAFQGPAGKTFGPVPWQLLVLGADYYADPSGLWIALAQKVDLRSDYVAVSYVTEGGVTVGSFPGQPKPNAGTTCASVDTLRMIVEPLVGNDQPSFWHEMRQFYRVAGQDLDPVSLKVDISLNRSERPLPPSSFSTYLGALGLSVPTDQNTFDRENRLFPRARDPGAELIVRESYLAFPNIKPFANPAALGPTELADSLYQTPVYLLFSQGPPTKYQFRLQYNSAGAGDRATLNLNALQVLEGSEKLYLGGRLLIRGTDYTIAYETGLITFLNPDALFGNGVAQITARFEERGIFAVAPTSIFGLTTHYDLGRTGGINFIGIYQRESSAFARPALRLRGERQPRGRRQHRTALQAHGPEPPGQLHHEPEWLVGGVLRHQRRVRPYPAGPEPHRAGLPRGVRGRVGNGGQPGCGGVAVRQPATVHRRPRSVTRVRCHLRHRRRGADDLAEPHSRPGWRGGAVLPRGYRHPVHHERHVARAGNGDVPDPACRHRRWRGAAGQQVAVDAAPEARLPAGGARCRPRSVPSASISPASATSSSGSTTTPPRAPRTRASTSSSTWAR